MDIELIRSKSRANWPYQRHDQVQKPDHKMSREMAFLDTLQQGFAIAIGHPYPETLQVLRKNLSTLRHAGYEIVPVSRLVR